MGYIYVMTNASFPDYVKIGYADNPEKRLTELNRSECIPHPFRLYAIYEVPIRLSDKKVHTIIDMLNPSLRSVDEFAGKKRKKEFFCISPDEAFRLLQAIAEIHGFEDNLHRYDGLKEADPGKPPKQKKAAIKTPPIVSVADSIIASGKKVGQFVQEDIVNLINCGKVNKEEIENLTDKKYCNEQFKVKRYIYPMLKEWPEGVERKSVGFIANAWRYYSGLEVKVWGKRYLISSQWYSENLEKLIEWYSRFA